MAHKLERPPHRACAQLFVTLACLLIFSGVLVAQTEVSEWQQTVRDLTGVGRNADAFHVVENRLQQFPQDLEAHGWRGRLLAWRGDFQSAEAEYRLILLRVPQDGDILISLSDVLLWQKKYDEALEVIDRAGVIAPANVEVMSRRARLLFLLDRVPESREQYRSLLLSDPFNRGAGAALAEAAESRRNDLRIGEELDILSYAGNTESQIVSLTSRWNQRWTTLFAITSNEMFGEKAVRVGGGAAFRFRKNDWVRMEAGIASPQNITSERDALLEYGHGFKFSNPVVRGFETSYQQRWLWYRGARVLTFAGTEIVYLPREWLWALSVTRARTCFLVTGCALVPSGSTKITFPLTRTLSGNLLYAVGSENFSRIDQIGRISAHSYGGGARYQLSDLQDLITSLVVQKRQSGQTQISLGITYGLRF